MDGKKVGEGRIEHTTLLGKFSLDESFDVGQDTGSPVIDEYDAKMPFKFTGTLRRVEMKLGPDSGHTLHGSWFDLHHQALFTGLPIRILLLPQVLFRQRVDM